MALRSLAVWPSGIDGSPIVVRMRALKVSGKNGCRSLGRVTGFIPRRHQALAEQDNLGNGGAAISEFSFYPPRWEFSPAYLIIAAWRWCVSC